MTTGKPVGFEDAMEFELHELCQPLTTLRCRLELAMMLSEDEGPESVSALKEAVEEGLTDIRRIFCSVERLRQRMLDKA